MGVYLYLRVGIVLAHSAIVAVKEGLMTFITIRKGSFESIVMCKTCNVAEITACWKRRGWKID